MTIVRHELRQGRTSLAVWTLSIAFLLSLCIFMFPEMKDEMEQAGNLFASMGSLSAAFSLERLDLGTLAGFYAVECGSILGLGGAFFASLIGISSLAKEEQRKTAEFLLTHPVSRTRIVTEKLLAVLLQISLMNLVILGLSLLSVSLVDNIPWREILLIHAAHYLLQLELAGLCFGISAFLRRSGTGIAMGLPVAMYALNLIANMTERAKGLKYVTPFGYCEGADIIAQGRLDTRSIAIGMLMLCLGLVLGYGRYCTKDMCG